MRYFTIDYVTVNMVRHTSIERGLSAESVRQAFAQRQLELGDTALAAHPVSPIVVREYQD